MNFVILDDSDYKRERIKQYIEEIAPMSDITEYDCARDFLVDIKDLRFNENKKTICENTMLFLDWNFPFYKNEMPEPNEGEFVLSELKRTDLNINTIIVSSDVVEVDTNEYDFVLGAVVDNSSIYQIDEYKKMIFEVTQDKNIENKGEDER